MNAQRVNSRLPMRPCCHGLVCSVVLAAVAASGMFAGCAEQAPPAHALSAAGAAPEPASPAEGLSQEALEATFALLDPAQFTVEDGVTLQRLPDGRVARLTLDPALQQAVTDYLMRAGKEPPHAGVVALEPATGRVLALVSVSQQQPPIAYFALRAQVPVASVFKLVTAAALLELGGVEPTLQLCYKGGHRRLTADQILGTAPTGERCGNLGDALAHSLNVVIARMAHLHLRRAQLEEMLARFGFNQEIPFELPVDISEASLPDDDVEWARSAAGFWNVDLSPLHGAMLAAAIANHGVMMRPRLVDAILDAQGAVLWSSQPEPWHTVMRPETAAALEQMGQATTTVGTAAEAFTKRPDWPGDLTASGKTGTLSNKVPFLLYTWFVGSAPIGDASVAVAAIVAVEPKWWFKGTHAAAETMLAHRRLRQQRSVLGVTPSSP